MVAISLTRLLGAYASPFRQRIAAVLALGVCCPPAGAVDVGLAGVFPGKALLTIDGGPPRTVAVGTKTGEGVHVLSVDSETATMEVDGRKRTLRVGQNVAAQPGGQAASQAVLTADVRGHFLTTGMINGVAVRFMVDTGASTIAFGPSEARRLGIDIGKGVAETVMTANGLVQASRVKLDAVRVGDIVMHGIDAGVSALDMPYVLLGMSFLNRCEMQRDGQTMTLRKRY